MRVKRTKSVKPALIQQGAEAFADFAFHQRVGTEKFRIVNIGVSKNNIEIAAENHRPAATEKLPRMPKKSVHPAQLIFKLRNIVRRIVGRVAVRQINRGDADRAFAGFDVGFQITGVFVCKTGKPLADNLYFSAAEHRYTVIAFLTEDFRLIAGHLQIPERKSVKLGLDFLQKDDIRPGFGQPGRKVFHTGVDGIDVVGRYFHSVPLPIL